MKKLVSLLLVAGLCISLVACGSEENSGDATQAAGDDSRMAESTMETEITTAAENKAEVEGVTEDTTASQTGTHILVVYFSATGNTRAVAENIANGLQADIYEIVPEEPYTDADLNYNDNNSRSTLEMKDASARPGISGVVDNFDQYDTVFLGYPIWWGEAPRILDTFVENYDFTGKTVIPFCTSASSGIGSSADTLKELAGSGDWMDGQRFNGTESEDQVMEWADQFEQ